VRVDLKDQATDVSSPVLLNAVYVILEASGRLWKAKFCRTTFTTPESTSLEQRVRGAHANGTDR